MGAERWIAAERGTEQIAVEIKGFSGRSEMRDLEQALGQCTLYETILEEEESTRTLYLAITKEIYESLFSDKIGEVLIRRRRLHLIVFNAETKEIVQWIPTRNAVR